MNSKHALVTGGTGFIGKPLCAHLVAAGYTVHVLTRTAPLSSTTQNSIYYIHDLNELAELNIELIINLAGAAIAQRWTTAAKQIIYNSRIDTTRHLIDYMHNAKVKPQLFISASAVGYYGTDLQQSFTEHSAGITSDTSFAQKLCQDWEKVALLAPALGVRTAILRIGPVLGSNGGILAQLLPSFYCYLGAQLSHGQQYLSWIDRDDLLALILFIITNEQLSGPINATAPYPVTNQEFSNALAQALHRPCWFKIPSLVLRSLFGEMAEEIMLHGQKVLPTIALAHGFKFSYPSIQASLAKIYPP